MQRLPRVAIAAATLACLCVAWASALRFVGSDHLDGRDGAAPPVLAFDDYSLQFYYGRLGSLFLAEGGSTYGYDPAFMAGYVKMPLYYPSSKPFELSLRLFSGLDPVRVFNATVFALAAVLIARGGRGAAWERGWRRRVS